MKHGQEWQDQEGPYAQQDVGMLGSMVGLEGSSGVTQIFYSQFSILIHSKMLLNQEKERSRKTFEIDDKTPANTGDIPVMVDLKTGSPDMRNIRSTQMAFLVLCGI